VVPSISDAAGETSWIASRGQETSPSPDACVESPDSAPVSLLEVYLGSLWSFLRILCEAKATVQRN